MCPIICDLQLTMNADEIHDGMNLELYYQWTEDTCVGTSLQTHFCTALKKWFNRTVITTLLVMSVDIKHTVSNLSIHSSHFIVNFNTICKFSHIILHFHFIPPHKRKKRFCIDFRTFAFKNISIQVSIITHESVLHIWNKDIFLFLCHFLIFVFAANSWKYSQHLM